MELVDFLKRAEDRSTLSQIILPFCSDATGERPPVALLTGNINLKSSLKRNGQSVVFEEELKRLETEIANMKLSKEKKIGQVVDLSAEMKRLPIDNKEVDEKEIEIKEDWTETDESLIRERRERKPVRIEIKESVSDPEKKKKELEDDIEELLKMAELEEENGSRIQNDTSKIKEFKKEIKEELIKPKLNSIPKLNLPKISSSNPLVGDVIERTPEPIDTSINDSKEPAPLKKSSRFSLRKQQSDE